jgi:hypothetical protein
MMDHDGRDEFEQGLKEVQVFTQDQTTYGLPTQIFFGGLVTTVGLIFTLPWFFGALFGVVFFFSMYSIHKTDTRAIVAWSRSVYRRANSWSAGFVRRKNFLLVDRVSKGD